MCVTDSDEHAQLALAGVLGIDIELDGEAGGDAIGQPGAAGSHFTGIVSGQNPKLEGTEETTDTVTTDTDPQGQQDSADVLLSKALKPCSAVLLSQYLRGTSSSAYLTATEYGPSTDGV